MEILKDLPLDEIKEWDKNPRKNDFAVEKLKTLIEKYGYIDPIVVDQNNVIRAGHTRYKALKSLSMKTAPLVLRVEFRSEQDAIGYAIADNKSMEWADWDSEKLKTLLTDLENFDIGLSASDVDDMKKVDLELDEIIENGFLNYAKELSDKFTISFDFDKKYQEQIKTFIKENGKEKVVDWIVRESAHYARVR